MNRKDIVKGAVVRKFDDKHSLHILEVVGEQVKCLRSDGRAWSVQLSDLITPDYKLVRSGVES